MRHEALLAAAVAAVARANADFTGVNLGVAGRGFVVVAAETSFRKGPVSYAPRRGDGVARVADHVLLSCVGHRGEADDLRAFVRESLAARGRDAGGERAPAAACAHFVRRELAERRRKRRDLPELRAGAAFENPPA